MLLAKLQRLLLVLLGLGAQPQQGVPELSVLLPQPAALALPLLREAGRRAGLARAAPILEKQTRTGAFRACKGGQSTAGQCTAARMQARACPAQPAAPAQAL